MTTRTTICLCFDIRPHYENATLPKNTLHYDRTRNSLPDVVQGVPAGLDGPVLQPERCPGIGHVKEAAVDDPEHVSRHAVTDELEVVELGRTPVVCKLRQLHEANGEDDSDDPHHHAFGDAFSWPKSLPLAAFLGLVSFRTSAVRLVARAEVEVPVRLRRHGTDTQYTPGTYAHVGGDSSGR